VASAGRLAGGQHGRGRDREVAVSPRTTRTDPIDPLPGLRRRLASEYGGSVPDESIDLAAREALADLSGARVRDFVPVFAWRRARRRLRHRAG
jgi:hypothetical protein